MKEMKRADIPKWLGPIKEWKGEDGKPREAPETAQGVQEEPGREAWVVFHRRSGSVAAVYFREPPRGAFDQATYGVLRARVGDEEIKNVHDLRCAGGFPERGRDLVGI